MDFNHLININLSSLSETDKEICGYISQHMNQIQDFTLTELAEKTYTSRSTLIRLLKKLGFSGFIDFKYSLTQPIHNNLDVQSEFIQELNQIDIPLILQQTRKLNHLLENASDIFLFSTGKDQALQAENFANFLLKKGIITTLVPLNLNSELTKNVLDHLKKDSLLIIFSHRGDNDILKTYFTPFSKKSIPIVAFTTFLNGWIQSISTITLSLNTTDTKKSANEYSSGLMHLLINIVAINLT